MGEGPSRLYVIDMDLMGGWDINIYACSSSGPENWKNTYPADIYMRRSWVGVCVCVCACVCVYRGLFDHSEEKPSGIEMDIMISVFFNISEAFINHNCIYLTKP